MVACRENGKETAMRLIKHFSSECEDDWEKESGLVNVLGETEHPNILTYCWHCKGMYLAGFFFLFFSLPLSPFFLGQVLHRVVFFRWSLSWGNSEKIRLPEQGADIPIMLNHELSCGRLLFERDRLT